MYVLSPSDRTRAIGAGAGPPPGRQTPTTGQVRSSSVRGRFVQLRRLGATTASGGGGGGRGGGGGANDVPGAGPPQGWTQPQRPSRSRLQASKPHDPGGAPHSSGLQAAGAPRGGRSSGQTRRIQLQVPSCRWVQGPRPPWWRPSAQDHVGYIGAGPQRHRPGPVDCAAALIGNRAATSTAPKNRTP